MKLFQRCPTYFIHFYFGRNVPNILEFVANVIGLKFIPKTGSSSSWRLIRVRQGVGSCSFILLWKEDFSKKQRQKQQKQAQKQQNKPKQKRAQKQQNKPQHNKNKLKINKKSKRKTKTRFSKEDGQTRTDALGEIRQVPKLRHISSVFPAENLFTNGFQSGCSDRFFVSTGS